MLILEKDCRESLVMKVSEDSDKIAKEVHNILNIKKRLRKENGHMITNIQMYGMLILNDYH